MAQQSHPRCVAQSPFRDAASRDHFHLWPFALFRCRAVSRSRSGKSRHRTARKPAESVENDPQRNTAGLANGQVVVTWLSYSLTDPNEAGVVVSHPDPHAQPDRTPIQIGEVWENPMTGERVIRSTPNGHFDGHLLSPSAVANLFLGAAGSYPC